MEVGEAILAVGAGARPASFEQFREAIDPEWIDEALAATGKASLRRRKFPAAFVVWLVIGMGLFRDRAIAQVVRHLDLVLPTPRGVRGRVTNGAIVRARDRLGPEPLAALFRQTAHVWARAAADAQRWRGLAVYGLDGTTLRLPDTPENEKWFGRPGTSRGGGAAGYPQLRCVVLSVLRQHLVTAAKFGPYRVSELELGAALWGELPGHSLVILDRGFTAYALFHRLGDRAHERHWLVRARGGPRALNWRLVERLGPGMSSSTWSRATARGPLIPSCLPPCASAPSTCAAAASGRTWCSPRCSTPRSIPRPNSPRSTTNAGSSN